MTNKPPFVTLIERDPETNELVVVFPAELLNELDFKDNEILVWSINQDTKSITIERPRLGDAR